MQDKSVVVGQRQRIGGQFVELRVLETERGLQVTRPLLLMQDIGDVVGAESAGGMSFAQSVDDGVWSILANQRQQFADLAG